jgi:hypothetical protein
MFVLLMMTRHKSSSYESLFIKHNNKQINISLTANVYILIGTKITTPIKMITCPSKSS